MLKIMRRLPQYVSLLAVSVFTLGAVVLVPVSAQESSDDPTSVKIDDPDASIPKPVSDDRKTTVKAQTEKDVTASPGELRARAQKLLTAERQDKKVKSLEARKESCQSRKTSLTKKSENYTRNSSKHLEVFTKIHDKVQAFQAEKQLTVSNYDELKAGVDAKKSAAAGAVKVLSEAAVSVDCTAEDPAATVATLKESVSNARTALHDYRLSIKDLVVALQTAKTSDDDTTEAN